ncbi:11221_t:CDS:2, partial [Racocetra persica]
CSIVERFRHTAFFAIYNFIKNKRLARKTFRGESVYKCAADKFSFIPKFEKFAKDFTKSIVSMSIGYKCDLCRRQGKKCYHDEGTLGKYKCKKCASKKVDCLVQCIGCYKNNLPFSEECKNCKVVIDVQPIRANFTVENGRIYVQTSNGTKAEVEQENLEALLKLLPNKDNIPNSTIRYDCLSQPSVSTVIDPVPTNPVPDRNYSNAVNFYERSVAFSDPTQYLSTVQLYESPGENYVRDFFLNEFPDDNSVLYSPFFYEFP